MSKLATCASELTSTLPSRTRDSRPRVLALSRTLVGSLKGHEPAHALLRSGYGMFLLDTGYAYYLPVGSCRRPFSENFPPTVLTLSRLEL